MGLVTSAAALWLAGLQASPLVLLAGLSLVPVTVATPVCHICGDTVEPARHAPDACPLATNPVSNSETLAGGVSGVTGLIFGSEMPVHYHNVMTQQKLTRIKRLQQRGVPGAINVAAMTAVEVFKAATAQTVAIPDAITRLSNLYATETDVGESARIKGFVELISKLNVAGGLDDGTILSGANGVGVHRYVYHLAVQIAEAGSTAPVLVGSSATSNPTIQGDQLASPTDAQRFHEAVFTYTVLLHSLGIVSLVLAARFMHRVVHRNLRAGLPWAVVAKMLEIYLELIDTHADYTLPTVIELHGGMDSIREDARARATDVSFSKGSEQPPPGSELSRGGKPRPEWNSKFSKDATKGCCAVYNSLNPDAKHGRKQLDEHGTCRFRHVCNQWVSDKGPNGICGSASHSRRDCNNPSKCDKPVQ